MACRVWTGPDSHNGIDSSCFNLTLLSKFQTSKLDQAFYYGCRNVGSWGYKSESGEKYKVYHGLKMFGDFVREFPAMCASASDVAGVTVLAAKSSDGGRKAVLVTDYRSRTNGISIGVTGVAPDASCTILVHDLENDCKRVEAKLSEGTLTLPKADANSAAFLVVF